MESRKLEFTSPQGHKLAARLDLPQGHIRAYAIFAHCFTCSKDLSAARRIAGELSRLGIAVLRFDFTGLGSSEGEFANTDFTSNVGDLVAAAGYLRENFEAPAILIGHSLGGAAVLAAAPQIAEVKGVATIGAPADVAHVLHNFHADIETIEREGEAEVSLAGRRFRIGRAFVEAAREATVLSGLRHLHKALLVLHAPLDQTVGIDNAAQIFTAARHPKSFVSLNKADHLLTRESDAAFAAQMIAAWAGQFLPADAPQGEHATEAVTVSETGEGRFQNTVQAGRHRLFADEPVAYGGMDSGPSPYDFLSAALGACTSMTLRMYADRKKLELGTVTVTVSHDKVHLADCAECSDEEKARGGKIDVFQRAISVDGPLPDEVAAKLEDIAGKCPVHRTLEHGSKVRTRLVRAQ